MANPSDQELADAWDFLCSDEAQDIVPQGVMETFISFLKDIEQERWDERKLEESLNSLETWSANVSTGFAEIAGTISDALESIREYAEWSSKKYDETKDTTDKE